MTIVPGMIAILLTLAGILVMIAAGLFALSVILSFAVSWCERVNSDPTVAAQRRPVLAVRLLITEFTSLLLTLLLRPLGWLPARIPAGPCRRPPVILLHGLFQNRSCLIPLQWRLRAAGFDRVISVNTPPWLDLETLTDRVRHTIAQVRAATGAEQVHLVGHSMGGIIARNFIQLHGGAALVANCVTLGSPHRGSKLAPFAVSRLGRALLPGSGLMTRLAAAPLPATVRFTAIYTRHDNIIVPMENARLEGADNIELAGMGHTTMLFSSRVAKAVVAALLKNS
ncbi:MAG: alpha/beta fold hydrolase [Desulfuromonadales bacterium]|nr:alpha/beta fold hydrolase [Desulfuromonadales bacterium]